MWMCSCVLDACVIMPDVYACMCTWLSSSSPVCPHIKSCTDEDEDEEKAKAKAESGETGVGGEKEKSLNESSAALQDASAHISDRGDASMNTEVRHSVT
jgi:hypothetical protein